MNVFKKKKCTEKVIKTSIEHALKSVDFFVSLLAIALDLFFCFSEAAYAS